MLASDPGLIECIKQKKQIQEVGEKVEEPSRQAIRDSIDSHPDETVVQSKQEAS